MTGNENHQIPLPDAAHLTKNFRDSHPVGTIIAHAYGKQAILDILNQGEGQCFGIRIYYAQDDLGAPKLVITGVDSNGNDLYNGPLAEFGNPCPSICSTPNQLNS